MTKAIHLILGDQLSRNLITLRQVDKNRDIILMAELWDEATYVKHHKKKIALVFSAMRHHAKWLSDRGYSVDYVPLNDADNTHSFFGEVERAVKRHSADRVVVAEGNEHRVMQDMRDWGDRLDIPVEILEDDRWIASHADFQNWANDGRKQLRMEYFYREMRKKTGFLMDEDGKPEGGEWNYDSENRKPPKDGMSIPKPTSFEPDDITKEVMDLVDEKFDDHFGDLYPFPFAVTREQALTVLDDFIRLRLEHFGDYQDAMVEGEAWMFHSHISFYMNCGLLDPDEVCAAVHEAYHDGRRNIPLNAAEGFIRQIIGWREYVRGLYWHRMPDYKAMNFFNAQRALPDFFWTAETRMNCLKQCISETKRNAYAHHIQRLMVLGNFALLAGIHPDEVNEWYMIVYADAYEWVELPNVHGMILYADGGVLGSKPYAAGGNYINKMSDYCKGCTYKVKEKTGADACPFNYLYWDFLIRNRDKLSNNPRLGMVYRTLDKMDAEKVDTIKQDSEAFLNSLS